MGQFPYKFCLITDFRFISDHKMDWLVEEAILGGVDIVQYRDHEADHTLRKQRAKRLRRVTADFGAALFVNSSVELTLEVGADGIQVGSSRASLIDLRTKIGPDKYIGISVHNEEEIKEAKNYGADFLMLSPIFRPGSKPDVEYFLGVERFSRMCQNNELPIIALGGITLGNVAIPFRLGACGIACITALLTSDNIKCTASEMRKRIDEITLKHRISN